MFSILQKLLMAEGETVDFNKFMLNLKVCKLLLNKNTLSVVT